MQRSDATNFTVVTPTLHPQITSVSPNPFSPHPDGRNDTTSFRVHLPDSESVSFSIRNGNGQTVNGPHAKGVLAAGNHVFHWDGKSRSGAIAGDGIYTIVVATSAPGGGVALHGTTTATVRVDDSGSILHGAGGDGDTFYPVVDGYLDAFGPKVTVSEGGSLWLQIFTATGTLVTRIAQPHAAAGTIQVNWNGRNRRNRLAAEGTFGYNFLAQDAAGNRSTTSNGIVHLSHKKLVTKKVTVTRTGRSGVLDRDRSHLQSVLVCLLDVHQRHVDREHLRYQLGAGPGALRRLRPSRFRRPSSTATFECSRSGVLRAHPSRSPHSCTT